MLCISRGKHCHALPYTDDDPDRVVVYSDGCCFNNGKHGAKGGIGVFWGDGDPRYSNIN